MAELDKDVWIGGDVVLISNRTVPIKRKPCKIELDLNKSQPFKRSGCWSKGGECMQVDPNPR
jgi:hypothetical protein